MSKMQGYFLSELGKLTEQIHQEAEKKNAALEKVRRLLVEEGFIDDEILGIINPLKPGLVFAIVPCENFSSLILLVGKQGQEELSGDFFPVVNTGGFNRSDRQWAVQWEKLAEKGQPIEGLKALAAYLEGKGFKPQPNGMIMNEFSNGSFVYKVAD